MRDARVAADERQMVAAEDGFERRCRGQRCPKGTDIAGDEFVPSTNSAVGLALFPFSGGLVIRPTSADTSRSSPDAREP